MFIFNHILYIEKVSNLQNVFLYVTWEKLFFLKKKNIF